MQQLSRKKWGTDGSMGSNERAVMRPSHQVEALAAVRDEFAPMRSSRAALPLSHATHMACAVLLSANIGSMRDKHGVWLWHEAAVTEQLCERVKLHAAYHEEDAQ